MKEKRILKLFISILLSISIADSFNRFCFAAWSESEPIKVGIFPLGDFQNYDEEGKEYGYNVEYLSKIAELKHWNYEYIKVNNWVEGTELLEKGELDLLAPAQNIPDLKERFSYAAFPMGTEAAAIYALDSRDDLIYQDFETMKNLHYGGAVNSTFTQNFLNRMEQKGIQPNISYYANTSELFDALNKKEVDAIVTNIMFSNSDIKIIDRFSPLPVYYISQKENTYLLDELYDAMCTIELNEPLFETELMGKFFPYYNNTDFTYDELEYIKKLPEISVGYLENGKPLSYKDKKTGEFRGITRDILDKISEISGIKFSYIALSEDTVGMENLKELGVYVLCGVEYNEGMLSIPELWLSTPYLRTEKVLVGKEDLDLNTDETLILTGVVDFISFPSILNKFSNFEVTTYQDIETCLKMMRRGKADVLVQNRYIVEPYLAKPIYRNMKILPIQSIDENLCIATVHPPDDISQIQQILSNKQFLSIINKSIQHITSDQINDIIIRHTSENQYQYQLSDFIYQYWHLLLCIVLFLTICILGLIKIQQMKENENKILSQSIEQANRANIAKSRFLSNMSHEIRTPLNAIVGMTTLAQKIENNPQKTTQYLEKIAESSKLLMAIINDVLDMSAIESQKLKISHETFDFKSLLTNISELYYTQCRQKEIEFEMKLEKVKQEVLIGDALRLNQILMNLLSNAYKFTEPGGAITVTVSETMNVEEKKKVFLRFTVADTGCGMSEEMQKRLFTAFEQETPATALKHGGSGLGLAITKNLVDLMHGAIDVKSEKGEGSTFIVDLPFDTTKDVILADTGKLTEMRVMVVDDDSYMREYITAVLSGMGIRFDVTENGEEALIILEKEMLRGDPYDICFVDWRMSEMDGIEVTRKIREKISKDILMVIISAYNVSEIEEEAQQAGVDRIITKPLFQSTIYNILMTVHEKSADCSIKNKTREDVYNFTGKKALLAEDFELNREVAVDLLELVNLSVDCAEDGKQAVDMFLNSEPGTYDIIFMDIQMPNMDGYEAMRTIRSSEHRQASSIPIYAMTANAFAEDVSKALSAGANGHIAKPIDSDALYKLINKCLMEEKNI